MSITVNILYTGKEGNAKAFAQEMTERGIVERIRAQEGNERYEYFIPLEEDESILLVDRWTDQERRAAPATGRRQASGCNPVRSPRR